MKKKIKLNNKSEDLEIKLRTDHIMKALEKLRFQIYDIEKVAESWKDIDFYEEYKKDKSIQ